MLILLVDFYKPYVMKYAPSNALFCQFERHRLWIQMWFKTLYLFFIILVSCLRSCSFRCRQILAILLAAFKKELILAELLLRLFLPRFFGLSIICTSVFTDVDYSNRSKTRTYFIFLKAFYFSKTLSSIICIAVFRTFDYLYLGFPDFRLFFYTSIFRTFDFLYLGFYGLWFCYTSWSKTELNSNSNDKTKNSSDTNTGKHVASRKRTNTNAFYFSKR